MASGLVSSAGGRAAVDGDRGTQTGRPRNARQLLAAAGLSFADVVSARCSSPSGDFAARRRLRRRCGAPLGEGDRVAGLMRRRCSRDHVRRGAGIGTQASRWPDPCR